MSEDGINRFPCPECGAEIREDERESEWLVSILPLVLFRELLTVGCPECTFEETYVWKHYGPYLESVHEAVRRIA